MNPLKYIYGKKPGVQPPHEHPEAPGALVYVGEQHNAPAYLRVVQYNEAEIREVEWEAYKAQPQKERNRFITWIMVVGVHKPELVKDLGEVFALHPLLLEDIMDTRERPKVEEYDNCIYFTLKGVNHDAEDKNLDYEHVSMVLGQGWVISLEEEVPELFAPMLERMQKRKGYMRSQRSDYLMYRMLDIVVDDYYPLMDWAGKEVVALEERVLENPTPQVMRDIQTLKKELIYLNNAILPLREATYSLCRRDIDLVDKKTIDYLRDVLDHINQAKESVDTYTQLLGSLMDLYQSALSNKMNGIMKVWTLVGAIFLPLTFVTGLYGMNFDNMPELHYRFGYQTVLAVMIGMSVGMVWYMRRKGWFS